MLGLYFSLFICCLRKALSGLVLQFVEFVLSAIQPHEENGTEYRQNHRNDCVHDLNSNP